MPTPIIVAFDPFSGSSCVGQFCRPTTTPLCAKVIDSTPKRVRMSLQIFLQGKILGIDDFLLAPAADNSSLPARSHYITLASELLPRALLAELGLAKILRGSSGGAQFMVILPQDMTAEAETFLNAAAAEMSELSGGHLRLVWASTENLGDWSDVRRRLAEQMLQRRDTPLAGAASFKPFQNAAPIDNEYFSGVNLDRWRSANELGWNPENPARISASGGKHVWQIAASSDGITLARHAAHTDDGESAAGLDILAARAQGRDAWGVLRGDVDNFGVRVRRAQTIEEHVQLSVVFKQFFAGELEVACSMPEYWRRVTILYSGGDDFAVYGSWDALIVLAREVQRLFHKFTVAAMSDFPGQEAKTISMALSVASHDGATLAEIYEEAGRALEIAKTSGKDCFLLLGRTLEWKHMVEAAELKDRMARMVTEFGCSPHFLQELAGFYRETPETELAGTGKRRTRRFDRPWRFYRRLNRLLTGPRGQEFQRLRNNLIGELIGRGQAQRKLRPAGRVALEWARLSTGV